jgi:hypothetical protein
MILAGKNCPSATSSTTDPTQTDLGVNPGCCGLRYHISICLDTLWRNHRIPQSRLLVFGLKNEPRSLNMDKC